MTFLESERLSFEDTLQQTWRIYKLKFTKFILVSLTFRGPYYIIFVYLYKFTFLTQLGKRRLDSLFFVFFLIETIAFIVITNKTLQNENDNTGYIQSLKTGWSLLWKLITTNFLAGGIIILGLLLLVIPGIALLGYYQFTTYIVVLRQKKNMDAIRYSKDIVTDQWWKLFGYWLGIWIVIGLPSWILYFLNKHLFGSISFAFIYGFLYTILSYPFSYVFHTILFLKFEALYQQNHQEVLQTEGA